MKAFQKLTACVLAAMMLLCGSALGEEIIFPEDEQPEIGVQEGTQLTVGSTTPFSGMFFSSMYGYNTTDMDVRLLLHGYGTVAWTQGYDYQLDPTVVTDSRVTTDSRGGKTYTITLADGLCYNDGTPITAADYVFSVLLKSAGQIAELNGDNTLYAHLSGYEAYASGEENAFSGVRLLSDRRFSLRISPEYLPFFYELTYVDVQPVPIQVLAPGCAVKDDGRGAYIEGDFSAETLKSTLLNPTTGYLHYPRITSGPYSLENVDMAAHEATFVINPNYLGNYEGKTPHIERVRIVPVTNDSMFDLVDAGVVDVLHKVSRLENVNTARERAAAGNGLVANYLRAGYGFLSFACEEGPTMYESVRQAVALCVDQDAVSNEFAGEYALRVYGCYGFGQWMPLYTDDETDMITRIREELRDYPVNLPQAERLLIQDGWTLDENGDPFVTGKGKVRYKEVDGELLPLVIRLARPDDSPNVDAVTAMLERPFAQLGIGLETEDMSFTDMLCQYYRQTPRTCNLYSLATNFNYVFDPYFMYATGDEYQGTLNTSGLRDEQLEALALRMRETEPGDNAEYAERWLAFQKRWSEVLPAVPLYSNIYFDYYPTTLREYFVGSFSSWALAMPYAWYEEQ